MVWIPEARIWIGRTEVTWDEYEVWYFKKDLAPGADASTRPSNSYEPHDNGWGAGRRPAIKINRQAALRYCEWLSALTGKTYGLPSDREWEIACGPAPADPREQAWFAVETTHEVATKKPNARGLHDMLGNAWEYVADDEDGRPVIRGGAYNSKSVLPPPRERYDPAWNERDPQRPRSKWWVCDGPFLGFRVARSE